MIDKSLQYLLFSPFQKLELEETMFLFIYIGVEFRVLEVQRV